jgi:glutamine synthetase
VKARNMESSERRVACELVEARFVDLGGRVKAMTIPLQHPSGDVAEIARDAAVAEGVSVDGSSIAGYARIENSDMHLAPDKETILRLPYDPRRAAVYCDLYQRGPGGEHTPFDGDPRGRLKAALAEWLGPEERMEIKPELEFFVTRNGEPADAGAYIDVYPRDELSGLMDEVFRSLGEMGIRAERVHHECAPGQVEVEIDYAPILAQADNLVSAKTAIQALAHRAGLRATFMPKPFAGVAGSGMHVHFRLLRGERNLFGAEGGELSEAGRQFAGGLLSHAAALTAVCNPSVNSYKRLVPGHEAPVYVCWGYRNRSALVRIPLFAQPGKASVEFRSPDATSNFYLALAGMVAAGMEGVRNKVAPPEPTGENVYELSAGQRRRLRVKPLPGTLGEALDALERDRVVMSALGETLAPRFLEVHRGAWDEYLHGAVTDWERMTYGDA